MWGWSTRPPGPLGVQNAASTMPHYRYTRTVVGDVVGSHDRASPVRAITGVKSGRLAIEKVTGTTYSRGTWEDYLTGPGTVEETMKKLFKRSAAAAGATAILLTGIGAPALAASSVDTVPTMTSEAAAPATVKNKTLAQFESNLKQAARGGDSTAKESLAAFSKMTQAQKNELSDIMVNDGVVAAAQREGSGVVMSEIKDCQQPMAAAKSATYNVTSRCDKEFKFAGISITKVRLTGTYVTGQGRVLRTTGVAPAVIHNYEPGASISFSNNSHRVAGGKGYFQSTVTVTRNIFGLNHSTRSANQQLVTNGPGVVSCKWV